MASSPPGSPSGAGPQRPMSAMIRPPRSSSRMSTSSKFGGGSRASDEDGKTSVKVAVRVRPPLKPTDPGYELIPQRFQRSMVQVTSPTSLAVDSPQGRKLFVFDRVFGEDVDQEGVWGYLNESVNAFTQGYNVSLLAYGQSGAGKSYTMGTSGPAEQNDAKVMGVIPRAAIALFEKLGAGSRTTHSGLRTPARYSTSSAMALSKPVEKNWVMKATYVEIYNEQLRDLLLPEQVPQGERGNVTIREDAKGRILLTGLHQVTINSIDDLLGALNFGSSIRQTDATAINAKSSRSHAVFSLNLIQRKHKGASGAVPVQEKRFSVPTELLTGSQEYITVDSKFHFVDLAGSERLKNTGAQGERAKEGISINAGLASLGKVISQLSSRQAGSHVSYRDSKLTRLLQDSLGGNAITYMIACVTPAEFHLSETLNTVQYAQRARAIQSKPRIQQVNDESDKQALIDRLRAEVAFLREQIRNSERGDRRSNAPQERSERANEKEHDLQNQLLDMQENYTALSQRHAKLISEITKAGREDPPGPDFEGALGDTAVERLKRSNSFAEAVEQVVLEYEKTIQSLESSLSSTRSSLSASESTLLEKETKLAYIETVNTQLQARLQKMMDRESSTENYLHDLEAKLDGHTSGEEKNSAIVMELRKEIARVRENEASCEDYISTLEERLAEADQDLELMQREIDRLEHVVERQRSLGKLDNLLYELDHIQQDGKKTNGEAALPNGNAKGEHPVGNGGSVSEDASPEVEIDTISDHGERPPVVNQEPESIERAEVSKEVDPQKSRSSSKGSSESEYPQQSPAQSKFVAEKLENVTQELFDLRMEHESTLGEFDLLAAKYEEALRTLAELQETVDESRHSSTVRDSVGSQNSIRPAHFLEDARISELKDGETGSSSRSLLSELSLAGESPTTTESSEVESAEIAESVEAPIRSHEETLSLLELENIRKMNAEKEAHLQALAEQFQQLQEEHQETLDVVEELKAEVQKAKMNGQPSPTHAVIRRKSSQNVMIIDKAHRSFASLRNIAGDHLEDKPDVMQNFELNLNAAMHELHTRSERIQELEADIASIKKEMETKSTIISGLTRERSSIKNSSPMDISVVSSMRDQLLQSENQIRILQESHASREQELVAEIQALNSALESRVERAQMEMQALIEEHRERDEMHEKTIYDLQEELADLHERHRSAVDSMKASEQELLSHMTEMEAAMTQVEALRAEHNAETDAHEQSRSMVEADFEGEKLKHKEVLSDFEGERLKHQEVLADLEGARLKHKEVIAGFEVERLKHKELVENLQKEIDEHKSTIDTHVARVAQLEEAHATAVKELIETSTIQEVTETELISHRDLISSLQQQISEHQKAIEDHQEGVKSLIEFSSVQLEEVKTAAWESARAETESRLAEQAAKHETIVNALHAEAKESKEAMDALLERFIKLEVAFHEQETIIENLRNQVKVKTDEVVASEAVAKALQNEVNGVRAEAEKHLNTISELKRLQEESLAEIEKLDKKNQKNSRLVEELEQELSSTFDRHQATTNRLSSLQTERNAVIEEAKETAKQAQADAEALREQVAVLEKQLAAFEPGTPTAQRSNSQNSNSNLRKSASTVSLPSPPPAIPLPPLPNNVPHPTIVTVTSSSQMPAPPTPTMSRRPSKDFANSQLADDQEARIRTIEKHLFAEKQLTATLEEALTDLEKQGKKTEEDLKEWKKKCWALEDEMERLKTQSSASRYSMQAVEEERNARREAEAARAHLEERMNAINKKKKGRSLACF